MPLAEMLVEHRRSFTTSILKLCPACTWARQKRQAIWSELGVLAGVVVLITVGYYFGAEYRRLGMSLAGYLAGSLVGLIAHEGAHAVVAWLTGLRVWRIELGQGKRWAGFNIGGVAVHLRRFPTMGFVVAAPIQAQFPSLRYAAMLIAGPIINLALTAIVAAWIWQKHGPIDNNFAYGFMMANLIMFVFNLWPRHVKGSDITLMTDGAQLLGLLLDFGKTHRARRNEIALATEITERMSRNENEQALSAFESAENDGPFEWSLQLCLMVVYIKLGRFAEGHAVGVALLEDDSLEATARAMILNNTAWAGLLDGQKSRSAVFARYVDFALETLPTHFALLGTRGACAVAEGDAEKGRLLMQQAMAQDEDGQFRAIHSAWLAAAANCEGKAEAACQMTQTAQNLAPESLEVKAILRHYVSFST